MNNPRTFDAGAPVSVAVFSPDSKKLATASAGEVDIWSTETGKKLVHFKGHDDDINALAFTPDGKTLISHSLRDIKLWDIEGEKLIKTLGR